MNARALLVALLGASCALIPATALPQALTSLSSVRVGYTMRRNTVKPQGELKAQIDALEAQIAEATRLGRSGELRRLFAKGIALLNGRPWNDAADYSSSLVLRTDRVVVDSSRPYSVRLEQIYTPSIELQRTLTAHVALRKRPAPAAPNQPPPEPAIVKDLGTFDGVARDLRESPFFFDLDLHDVADGPYLLTVDVSNQDERIGGGLDPDIDTGSLRVKGTLAVNKRKVEGGIKSRSTGRGKFGESWWAQGLAPQQGRDGRKTHERGWWSSLGSPGLW
jgi:hypothetical protein